MKVYVTVPPDRSAFEMRDISSLIAIRVREALAMVRLDTLAERKRAGRSNSSMWCSSGNLIGHLVARMSVGYCRLMVIRRQSFSPSPVGPHPGSVHPPKHRRT
jgi:hypothetical protein